MQPFYGGHHQSVALRSVLGSVYGRVSVNPNHKLSASSAQFTLPCPLTSLHPTSTSAPLFGGTNQEVYLLGSHSPRLQLSTLPRSGNHPFPSSAISHYPLVKEASIEADSYSCRCPLAKETFLPFISNPLHKALLGRCFHLRGFC